MATIPSANTLRIKIIGALIRDARLKSGKDIPQCAQLIGVPVEKFEKYELGEEAISLPELEIVAYHLNTPLEHFWENRPDSISEKQLNESSFQRLIPLRNRMIGASLRQARMDSDMSLQELADQAQMDEGLLESYEMGDVAIPLPHLEALGEMLNRSIRDFQDQRGPVGTWNTQQIAMEAFMEMPTELQTFVSKPINRPYLELAQKMSQMDVDRLRAVAEGLLEITY